MHGIRSTRCCGTSNTTSRIFRWMGNHYCRIINDQYVIKNRPSAPTPGRNHNCAPLDPHSQLYCIIFGRQPASRTLVPRWLLFLYQNQEKGDDLMGRKKKHPNLPNGYGSIRKLSGNRRNPYAVHPPVTEFAPDGKADHSQGSVLCFGLVCRFCCPYCV